MFLPVFAQFAGVMFFLAGLGILNLVWLPVLADDTRGIRSAAASALDAIGSEEAVDPLLEHLDDPSPWTRATIVYALGELGSARAVEPLLRMLDEEDLDVNMRRAVIVALGQIGSPSSDAALRRVLDDEDAEVRRYTAEALRGLN